MVTEWLLFVSMTHAPRSTKMIMWTHWRKLLVHSVSHLNNTRFPISHKIYKAAWYLIPLMPSSEPYFGNEWKVLVLHSVVVLIIARLSFRAYANGLSTEHDDVIKWKIFRVTGPLCGEFTSHRWIARTKASDAELWCFLWSAPEQAVE